MKKTTKKLVSLLLTLVLALSVSSISAFAINASDVCVCGHPAVRHYGTYYANCNDCSGSMCSAGEFTYPDPIVYTTQITLDGKDYLYDSNYVTNYGSSLYCDIHKELAHKYSEWEAPSGAGYSKCLEAGHIKIAAPDWFDDVTTKVDAAYDKLVATINGTEQTFASTHPGYTFAELIGILENVSYSQDGNVYTITGESAPLNCEIIVTLDADGNVVSVSDKGVLGTAEMYNDVYTIPQTNNQTPAPEKKEEAKKDDKKTSPATGATMGLGALGLGVALLAVLKKKED